MVPRMGITSVYSWLQIMDPAMKDKIVPECLRKFGEVAVSCLMDNGSYRPSMNDVVSTNNKSEEQITSKL